MRSKRRVRSPMQICKLKLLLNSPLHLRKPATGIPPARISGAEDGARKIATTVDRCRALEQIVDGQLTAGDAAGAAATAGELATAAEASKDSILLPEAAVRSGPNGESAEGRQTVQRSR